MFNSSLYIPRTAFIKDVKEITQDTKLFKLVFKHKQAGLSAEEDYKPGQFVQVSLLGAGEAPISIASSPAQKGYLELAIRNVGAVTNAMSKLKVGDEIGIRGPYGNFYPLEQMKAANILFIGGGCGLAPLRSLISFVFEKRKDYEQITVLYGCRTKNDMAFKDELRLWRDNPDTGVFLSVDCGPADHECSVGLVTSLFKHLKDLSNTFVFVCGPPVMIHFCIKGLLPLGAQPQRIIVSLERYMKCGVGKCGHCYLGGKYVCTDGPVFTYAQMQELAAEEVIGV